eukprot:3848658-Karenia_brevis.AAC.1
MKKIISHLLDGNGFLSYDGGMEEFITLIFLLLVIVDLKRSWDTKKILTHLQVGFGFPPSVGGSGTC